jgi:hypothetical protein
MNKNRATKGSLLPVNDVVPKRFLNSMYNLFVIMLIIIIIFVGTTQNIGEIISIKIIVLTQFNGVLINDEGSNTENRLVIIIFRLFYGAL